MVMTGDTTLFDFESPPQKYTLGDLRDLLRDSAKWPEGFEWDYGYRYTCAMGLASRVFDLHLKGASDWCIYFEIDYDDLYKLFIDCSWWQSLRARFILKNYVTPEMVAKRIDKFLKSIE
jgi:hypothetical protein